MIYKPQPCRAHDQTWCAICQDDDDWETRRRVRDFERSDLSWEDFHGASGGVSSRPTGPVSNPESGVVGHPHGRPAVDVIDDEAA